MTTRNEPSPMGLAVITLLVSTGCQAPPRSLATPREVTTREVEVETEPTAPADLPASRRIHRMTADQLAASLEIATGQPWTDFEANAATPGRAAFTQVTEEGEQISVAFERLFHAAAREGCHAAVTAEREEAFEGERAILGAISIEAPSTEDRDANLRRLLLRFHGHEITSDADSRLAPWRELLDAPIAPADLEIEGATEADVEALRWEAVCIGLATHVDFLTY